MAAVLLGPSPPIPEEDDDHEEDDHKDSISASIGDMIDEMFTSNIEFALREHRFDVSLLHSSRQGLPSQWQNYSEEGNQFLSVCFSMNVGSETETHLTGQVPWPVCHLLNWYMLAYPDLFVDKNVIEIGAGVGLSGLLLAEMDVARNVLITDGQDEIMDNLQANVLRATQRGRKVAVQQLRWENEDEIASAVRQLEGSVDIIIGADILAYTLGVPKTPLMAGRELMRLSAARNPFFIVAYHTRFGTHHLEKVKAVAAELGMTMYEIDVREFLPKPAPQPLDIFSIWHSKIEEDPKKHEEASPGVMLLKFELQR